MDSCLDQGSILIFTMIIQSTLDIKVYMRMHSEVASYRLADTRPKIRVIVTY